MTQIVLEVKKPTRLPSGTRWVRFDGDSKRVLRWCEMMGCKTFTYVVKEASPGVWHEAFSPVLEVLEEITLVASSEKSPPS
jgi:hypothetical protein